MNFEQPSYPQFEDFIALPFFIFFFPTVRFFLDRFIFEKVGSRLIFGKGMQVVENESKIGKKKIRKFKESAWKCVYFLSAEIFALCVIYNEPWFTNTKYFWTGPGNQSWPVLEYKMYLFQKVASRLIFGKGMQVVENEAEIRKKKIQKFKESAWKCVYFLSAEIYALSVSYNEPWFTNSKYFWTGPGNQVWPVLEYKLKLKGLHMYTGGFYVYSIFALIFWETRRSDFGVSMGHHVVSSALILLSYKFGFGRVGAIILALHDATDIFMEIGKMSKYSGAEAMASCSFAVFVLLWILLRLIYFPFWVLWSTSYEAIPYIDKEKYKLLGPICYYFFNSLLFFLLVLHVYWWVLMYRMLVAQIKAGGKVSEDVRSDSEDEDPHED